MTYTIDIQTNPYNIDTYQLEQAVQTVLDQHAVSRDSSLTIIFTDNNAVRQLNHQHRQLDAPTDVLSFPADPLPDYVTGEPPYLGDLIIAHPYTSATIEKQGVDFNQTLCLLVVHGTLHLLGYDHTTEDEKDEMWSAQADALQAIQIDPQIVEAYGKTNDE